MPKFDLRVQRSLVWALVMWICVSLPAFNEVAYSLVPSHTSRWSGLRQVVLEANAGYTGVSLGGTPSRTKVLNFRAEGNSGQARFFDWFSVWEGEPDAMGLPSLPYDDSLVTAKQITVGAYHVRVVLEHVPDSPDLTKDAMAMAESRWRVLEPAIRRYLERPRRTPGLRLIRNDLAILAGMTSVPAEPLEAYLVPIYLAMSIGRIPTLLFGLVILVVPFGTWPVYGSLAALAATLVGSVVLTEVKWRRSRRHHP